MTIFKRIFAVFLCFLLCGNNVLALNSATDLIKHSSDINPVTNGNITDITTTHPIDTYHWSSFNLNKNETANFIFTKNGQTALNYLSPGANPSTIYGSMINSGMQGNVLLFNPNGIMMGKGASISGFNTFFASTNQFDKLENDKILFSEPKVNKSLNVENININNINNVHFIAPNVAIKTDKISSSNSVSVRAIGTGKYNVSKNLFTNETGVKKIDSTSNTINVDSKIASKNVTVEVKSDSEEYAKAIISGEINANKAVNGEDGEVYIIASNDNSNGSAEVYQNASISSKKINIDSDRVCLNGNLDATGETGGDIDIKTKSLTQNGNITAKGTSSNGGNVTINAENYVAPVNSKIDVSGKTQGGNIKIKSDYQVFSSGKYDASSETGKGGEVTISAPLTKLYGTEINVSGKSEGGNVKIGDKDSSNYIVDSSYITMFNDGSSIDASSKEGKGGNVTIDSLGTSYAFGSINTRGDGNSGGTITLCGNEGLQLNTSNINTGNGGTITLDPKNIYITNSAIGPLCYNMLFSSGVPRTVSLNLTNQEWFGSSVALYNNLLAIGSQNFGATQHPGAAYLFYFNGGSSYNNLTLFTKLRDGVVVNGTTLDFGTTGANGFFGSSMALTNNLLAIGAQNDSTAGTAGKGVVWLFNFDENTNYGNLKINQKLSLPTSITNYASFGSGLALYEYSSTNALLAVGAEGNSTTAGKVYLYNFTPTSTNPYGAITSTTVPVAMSAPTTLQADYYGCSVALGDYLGNGILAVGADGSTTANPDGAVFLYSFNESTPTTQTLVRTINQNIATDLSAGDEFGSGVALKSVTVGSTSYELLAVGASYQQGRIGSGNSNEGAVYLFDLNGSGFTPTWDAKIAYQTQNLTSTPKIYNVALSNGYHFGSSVALGETYSSTLPLTYKDLLVIGSDGDSSVRPNAGATYLYSFDHNTIYNNLTQNSKLVANSIVNGVASLSANDNFGSSISIYGNFIGIGAPGDDTGATNAGAVYLYSFDSGTSYQNLTLYRKLSDYAVLLDTDETTNCIFSLRANDNFGSSISIYNNLFVVGAPGDDGTLTNTGAAYIFDFNPTTISNLRFDAKWAASGSPNVTYTVSNLKANDNFGQGVALTKNVVSSTTNNLFAIGATGDDGTSTTDAGAVYLFNLSNTAYTASPTACGKIASTGSSGVTTTISNLKSGDKFGYSDSLYSNYLGVGAIGDDGTSTTDSGAIYLMSYTANTLFTSPIVNSKKAATGSSGVTYPVTDLASGDNYGSGISINYITTGSSPYYLVGVGAMGNDTTTVSNCGATYLYSFSTPSAYANPTLITKLENGSVVTTSTGNPYTFSLGANEYFGSAVSIYNNLLGIGASGYSASTSSGTIASCGAAYLLTVLMPIGGSYLFTDYPADTLYLSATNLATLLQTSNLTLQANNDIIFFANVAVSGGSGNTLTLQAGRDIEVDSGVSLNFGSANLVATANENATGTTLVNAYRDSGSAEFNMQTGSSITSLGNLTINLNQGLGKTYTTSGDIILNNISGNNIVINNQGTTSGSDIIFNGIANATNPALTADISAATGNITFSSGTTSTFANNLSLTASGNIAQADTTSTINVQGQTNLNTTGTVTLNGTNNDFCQNGSGQVYIASSTSPASSATINDTNSILVGNSYVTNALNITAKNNITQCAATTINSGSLNLTSTNGGNITQADTTSTINVQGQTNLNTTGTITLNGTNNDFCKDGTSQVYIASSTSPASSATINDTNSILVGNSYVTNALNITAKNNITQCAATTINSGSLNLTSTNGGNITQADTTSTINVQGQTNLNTTGTVTLNGTNNDFCKDGSSQVYIASSTSPASYATINDTNSILIGNSYVTNALNVTAKNDITQCANTTINSGTLNLTSTSGGNITQADTTSTINVQGQTDLNTTGTVTLNGTNNDFCKDGTSQVYIASSTSPASSATINDTNSILIGNSYVTNALNVTAKNNITQCAATTINSGSLNLTSTNGGNITQAATTSTINVQGQTNLNTTGTVTLNGTNNDFCKDGTSQVYIASSTSPASSATINDTNSILVGNSYVTNALNVTAKNNITQCANTTINSGSLNLTSTNGDITQADTTAKITTTGTSTLSTGTSNNIILNNTDNDFGGNITIISAQNVDIFGKNDLGFDSINNSGTLNVNSGQNITFNGNVVSSGNITVTAPQDIIVNNNITSTNGDFTATANNGSHSSPSANFTMATGTTISSANGDINISIPDNLAGGNITLSNLTGQTITAWNKSLTTGTDVIINPTSTISATSTTEANPLIISSDGGNFINNSTSTALNVPTGQRWLVYTGSPADTTLGGITPVNTIYSSTIYTAPPTTVTAGNSVLYRTPNPTPAPGGGGGGGTTTTATGGIVAGSVVGGAAVGGSAAAVNGLGLLPGLLLGLASPIQFDECTIDAIDPCQNPLLVRNMQCVFNTCDITKLDACKIGHAIFIPDTEINNGSFEIIGVRIPKELLKSPKGVIVKITQKSLPFSINKNIPDMNFNVFDNLSDKKISSIYRTRRFLRQKYLAKQTAKLIKNSSISSKNGILEKTIIVNPHKTGNDLSIVVNYLKNGQILKKNSVLRNEKQSFSLIIQFLENK